MVKLIIEIKEEDTIETDNFQAIGSNIHIQEIGKEATKNELKVSNILKNRLKLNEKLQIESINSKDKLKSELEKLLKSL